MGSRYDPLGLGTPVVGVVPAAVLVKNWTGIPYTVDIHPAELFEEPPHRDSRTASNGEIWPEIPRPNETVVKRRARLQP